MSSAYNSFAVQPGHIPSEPSKNKYLIGFDHHTFKSEAEVLAAMQDERYSTDADFRQAVQIVLGRSPGILGDPGRKGVLESGMANRQGARAIEDAEIQQEQTLKLFNTDLYRTSPTERKRVRELIAANEPAVKQAMGHRVIDRNLQKSVRIQLTDEDLNNVKAALAKEKADGREAAAQQAAQAAYDHAMNGGGRSDDSDSE